MGTWARAEKRLGLQANCLYPLFDFVIFTMLVRTVSDLGRTQETLVGSMN